MKLKFWWPSSRWASLLSASQSPPSSLTRSTENTDKQNKNKWNKTKLHGTKRNKAKWHGTKRNKTKWHGTKRNKTTWRRWSGSFDFPETTIDGLVDPSIVSSRRRSPSSRSPSFFPLRRKAGRYRRRGRRKRSRQGQDRRKRTHRWPSGPRFLFGRTSDVVVKVRIAARWRWSSSRVSTRIILVPSQLLVRHSSNVTVTVIC